jgi:polyisoprenyl-phosphate glycosyltransferase
MDDATNACINISSISLISIVVPVYNEQEVLFEFHQQLCDAICSLKYDFELIFVDDGSKDGTLNIIQELRKEDLRISLISLSRNFGKDIAMTAGLDKASGKAVIVIDADLQDPPSLIPKLVEEWEAGYDAVYAKRIVRDGESIMKRVTAKIFYKLMRKVSVVPIPQDVGDFRLLSRRAVDALNQLREQHRFMKGLFAWIGFSQKSVSYRRNPRAAGKTKWNYWRLWNFALEGITSFSTLPLKFSTYLGISTALIAFVYGLVIMASTLIYGNDVPGYPSLMLVILFMGGVQLFAIGILGEYIGRVSNEIKRRPLYVVDQYIPPAIGMN